MSGDPIRDLREALYFALSNDYEIASDGYERAAETLFKLGWTRSEPAVQTGPRTWAVPDEPGPEVLAVRVESTGQRWGRRYAKDRPDMWRCGFVQWGWAGLLGAAAGSRILDATAEAALQDGDDQPVVETKED